LAGAIGHLFGPQPGALHLRSDVERKVLYGVAETHRLGAVAYTQAAASKVYETLIRKARQALAAGRAVIADAVFAQAEQRQAIEQVAHEAQCPFLAFWLTAPSDLLFRRVAGRTGDASDADKAVVEQQLAYDTGKVHWHLIDAGGSAAAVQTEAEKLLKREIAVDQSYVSAPTLFISTYPEDAP
jgi:predicted kinase